VEDGGDSSECNRSLRDSERVGARIMAEIQNLRALEDKLRKLSRAYGNSPKEAVRVGYTANYAVYVHENMEARHTVGQAKYLEKPAREMKPEFRRIIEDSMRKGATLLKALLLTGLRLQRESQDLVPIDTGNLRASAFTEEDR